MCGVSSLADICRFLSDYLWEESRGPGVSTALTGIRPPSELTVVLSAAAKNRKTVWGRTSGGRSGDPLEHLWNRIVEKEANLLGGQRRSKQPALRLGDAVLGGDKGELFSRLDALDSN
jgi:hypothetical protein